MKKTVIYLLIAAGLLVVAGTLTRPYLGDEIYHFRFAKDIYLSNSRPIVDSQYNSTVMPTIFYLSPPFWNIAMAVVWKLTGGISYLTTQLFQASFYIILVLCTYLAAREKYTERTAFFAALLTATTPMLVSFSILLYTDIAVTALCMASLLLVLKRHYLLCGCVFGMAFLTKNNAAFFMPVIALFALLDGKCKLWQRLLHSALIAIPPLTLYYFEIHWRRTAFTNFACGTVPGVKGNNLPVSGLFASLCKSRILPNIWNFGNPREYLNSYIFNIKDVVMYLGAALAVSILLYILLRKYEKKDILFASMIGFYTICTFLIIGTNTDIRYFMPVIPLWCILGAKVISVWNSPKTGIVLACICILQFLATTVYVSQQRTIPSLVQKGFEYIKNNTPQNALIMYPEPNIQEYAQRKLIWSNFKSPTTPRDVFWPINLQRLKVVILENKIDYITIKKTRCYDDSHQKHLGGYPYSFVKKLPKYDFMQLRFENEQIAVWEILKEKLH